MGGRGASSGGGKSRDFNYSIGREMSDEEYKSMEARLYAQERHGELERIPLEQSLYSDNDKYMQQQLSQLQGFDKKPTLVSDTELDSYIAKTGAVEVWRGLYTAEQAEQYRTGPLYLSSGIYGYGTYVALSKDAASHYASSENSIIRMALKPNAKVISFDSISSAVISGKIKNAGLYAISKGYDAIRVNEPKMGANHYVILNRTATVVSTGQYSP